MDNEAAFHRLTGTPQLVARYRAVLWEPIETTGERIAAIVCVEPSDGESEELLLGAFVVIGQDRLRTLLGRARGDAATGILQECASFMTDRLLRGVPIEQIQPLFHGFHMGPVFQGRAFAALQFMNAAVRTLSVFGDPAEVLPQSDSPASPTTRSTAHFLRQVRRAFAGEDLDLQSRFHVKMQRELGAPDVYVDYASGASVVQVSSVPASANQAPPAEAELKAKILDLEIIRREFSGNEIYPTLLLNVQSLIAPSDEHAAKIANDAHQQIKRYADWARLRVLEVATASEAAEALDAL